MTFDLAVVGAGPCGLGVGVAARQAGLRCVLFERGCLVQCIAGYPTYLKFFSTAEKLELGDVPFVIAGDKPTRREALAYYRRVAEHFELDIRQYEEVAQLEREGNALLLRTRARDGGAGLYRARNVVIATGYYDTPNPLGVPGEELPKVSHYYVEGHPFWRQDCMVVGGGNSAAEAALDLYRAGARVTLVHFAEGLDRGVKPWVLPDITGRIQNGEIAVRWRCHITEILPDRVSLRSESDGTTEELPNQWVFAMTGYTPDLTLLRSLGVSVAATTGIPSYDAGTLETDVPGVFVAGVIAAGYEANKIFIETGRLHGPKIVAALRGRGAARAASG